MLFLLSSVSIIGLHLLSLSGRSGEAGYSVVAFWHSLGCSGVRLLTVVLYL